MQRRATPCFRAYEYAREHYAWLLLHQLHFCRGRCCCVLVLSRAHPRVCNLRAQCRHCCCSTSCTAVADAVVVSLSPPCSSSRVQPAALNLCWLLLCRSPSGSFARVARWIGWQALAGGGSGAVAAATAPAAAQESVEVAPPPCVLEQHLFVPAAAAAAAVLVLVLLV